MSERRRFHRPEPERTAPRRDWSNLYRSSDSWEASERRYGPSGPAAAGGMIEDLLAAGTRLGEQMGAAFGRVVVPPTGGYAATNGRPVPLAVVIVSSRPVELELGLEPGPEHRRLIVRGLHEERGRVVRPVEVSFESSDNGDRGRLRIEVGDDQPPGLYRGTLVDEASGRVQGTLSLRIGDSSLGEPSDS